ncbi:MAG TPA: peptidylprolyl isomerase [Nevskiales bacterium]|nr:peptidylprolyl isomerase [Nevskiales bacterium]
MRGIGIETFRRGLREPLLRFLLLGLVILGVDRLLTDGDASEHDTLRIVVSAGRQAALAQAFRAEQGRAPQPEELQALLDRWIDEQVLYREALALGLDRRDVIVQRQLTQKMRFLIEDDSLLPEPDEAALQAWLDRYPERYGRAPTVSFEQVFLSRGRHGERLAQEAERLAAQLRREPATFVGLGDPFLVGQVVTQADSARLRRDFGAGFAEALAQLSAGEWSPPLPSAFGLHLVRITAREPFRPAALAEVAEQVRRDWRLAQREARNRAVLAELRARYRIEFEDAHNEGRAG